MEILRAERKHSCDGPGDQTRLLCDTDGDDRAPGVPRGQCALSSSATWQRLPSRSKEGSLLICVNEVTTLRGQATTRAYIKVQLFNSTSRVRAHTKKYKRILFYHSGFFYPSDPLPSHMQRRPDGDCLYRVATCTEKSIRSAREWDSILLCLISSNIFQGRCSLSFLPVEFWMRVGRQTNTSLMLSRSISLAKYNHLFQGERGFSFISPVTFNLFHSRNMIFSLEAFFKNKSLNHQKKELCGKFGTSLLLHIVAMLLNTIQMNLLHTLTNGNTADT